MRTYQQEAVTLLCKDVVSLPGRSYLLAAVGSTPALTAQFEVPIEGRNEVILSLIDVLHVFGAVDRVAKRNRDSIWVRLTVEVENHHMYSKEPNLAHTGGCLCSG